MLFRNLLLYRLPSGWAVSPTDLEDALARHPLRPCGGFDMQTRGWVHAGHGQRFLYAQGRECLLALGLDQKLLPASIINQEVKARAIEIEDSQGYPVSRRQRRELKQQITDELLARALTRQRTINGWLSAEQDWLAIDTTSVPRAEEFVESLRAALGSFAVQRLDTRHSAQAAMTRWLVNGDADGPFRIDDELELQTVGGGATIRYLKHELDGREISGHLNAGMAPTRLALVWKDRIAFVLQRDLQIRRIRFLDVYEESQARADEAAEQFDLDFALTSGELTGLLSDLVEVLGGYPAAEEESDGPRTLAEAV